MAKATWVSRLTADGRAAIATLAVRGPAVPGYVTSLFAPSDRSRGMSPHRGFPAVHFGRWEVAGDTREEIVLVMRDAEHIEIHCHGGSAVVDAIHDRLVELGASSIAWRSWLLADTQSALQVAAHHALCHSVTRRAAAILLDQYRGALDQAFAAVWSHVVRGAWPSAKQQIDDLLQRARVGLHLTRPWVVVLSGDPNVGKSSLLNAVTGYSRALVDEQPGTTRDAISAVAVVDGWQIEFVDTAGLRATDDAVERIGIERSVARAETADLILAVRAVSHDGTMPPSESIKSSRPVCYVVNKSDLLATPVSFPPRPDHPTTPFVVSARSGDGIPELLRHVAGRLVGVPPAEGEGVPFCPRQVDALRQVASAIDERDLGKTESLFRWLHAELGDGNVECTS